MKIITTLFLVFSVAIVSAQIENKFRKQLKQNDLVFEMPSDFTETEVRENGDLYYNYAIEYQKDTFEVRFTIFSLKPLLKDYEKSLNDPNKSVLNPNKFYKSMYMANVFNVSQLGMENIPPPSSFPEESVKKEFGADYGGTSFFMPNSEFSEGYKYCLMMVLHKKDVADIYVSFLGNNKEKFEEYMLKAFHSLRFRN